MFVDHILKKKFLFLTWSLIAIIICTFNQFDLSMLSFPAHVHALVMKAPRDDRTGAHSWLQCMSPVLSFAPVYGLGNVCTMKLQCSAGWTSISVLKISYTTTKQRCLCSWLLAQQPLRAAGNGCRWKMLPTNSLLSMLANTRDKNQRTVHCASFQPWPQPSLESTAFVPEKSRHEGSS